jgi:DNA-binding beta-propeller fold protein YncE
VKRSSMRWLAAAVAVLGMAGCSPAESNPAPAADAAPLKLINNYRLVDNFITAAPVAIEGTSAVTLDNEGNILAFRRKDAGNPNGGNVWKLDPNGRFIEAWGQDIAVWTHGIRVDPEGNIWTIDGQGHQIKKWSPDHSQLLMTLGELNVEGDDNDPKRFNRPTDVAWAPNGDFFVSDGYRNHRVVKFSKDGTFIKSWGSSDDTPFNTVHSIVVDKRNRVIVADRNGGRIHLFDLEGNPIAIWTHLGNPYALTVTADDKLYVSDGIAERIWIANAETGDLLGTIEKVKDVHWSAVDKDGNVYAASNQSHYLHKYVPLGATNQ